MRNKSQARVEYMKKIVSVSKARQLYEMLKEEIVSGKYANGDKLPSIRDLAEQYSLSKNTVNTVVAMLVNNGLAVVHEGNGTFVSSARQQVKMIGMLLSDFRQYMRVDTEILQHIQLNLPRNYYLSLMDTSNRYDVFGEALEHMIAMKPAGFLILPPRVRPTKQEAQRICELLSGWPTVLLNRSIDGLQADMYSMNLGRGIEKAFDYLAMSDKQRTAIVLHDDHKFKGEETEAYRRCCEKYGIHTRPEYMIEWKADMDDVARRLSAILPEIDSLICPDEILLGLQPIIHASGKEIPGQLSLVGVNDTVNSRLFNPPLTSIVFPVERIGRHAVNKLIRRIEGKCDEPFKQVNFEPELIIRNT